MNTAPRVLPWREGGGGRHLSRNGVGLAGRPFCRPVSHAQDGGGACARREAGGLAPVLRESQHPGLPVPAGWSAAGQGADALPAQTGGCGRRPARRNAIATSATSRHTPPTHQPGGPPLPCKQVRAAPSRCRGGGTTHERGKIQLQNAPPPRRASPSPHPLHPRRSTGGHCPNLPPPRPRLRRCQGDNMNGTEEKRAAFTRTQSPRHGHKKNTNVGGRALPLPPRDRRRGHDRAATGKKTPHTRQRGG